MIRVRTSGEEVSPSSLRKPVAFVGMPGVANVGKMAAVAIARSLESTKIAEIFCTDSPPSVEIKKDGRPSLPHGVLFFSSRSDSPRDVFVFTGDFQPSNNSGQYEYSDFIASTCKKYNVELMVALAASVCGFIPVDRRVWVTGTSSELIELFAKNKATKVFRGATISGVNGLAPVVAHIGYGINGVCLLADTYPLLTEDPAASKCLLEVVRDRLQVPVDTLILDKKVERMQRELAKIEGELTKRSGKPGKATKAPEYFG